MNAPLEQPAEKPRRKVHTRLIVIALGCMFGLPLLLRAFLLEAFQMPSGSMIPTLLIGDHFFVNKTVKRPDRGDVIVFKYPLGDDPYIKRVMGMPGDTVAIKDGELLINGKAVPRRDLGEQEGAGSGPFHAWEETLGKHTYTVFWEPRRAFDLEPVQLATDQYFVMGDNRDNSNDSRVWGPLPARNIHGRAAFIWYSADPQGGGLRWDRIGHGIQ